MDKWRSTCQYQNTDGATVFNSIIEAAFLINVEKDGTDENSLFSRNGLFAIALNH